MFHQSRKRKIRPSSRILILGSFLFIGLTGCNPEAGASVAGSPAYRSTPDLGAISTSTPVTVQEKIDSLVLWLPPAFRPDSGTPAGDLLNQRIKAFEAENPGLTVVVRLKASSGPGGVRDSMSMSAAAAPDSLPDVVALDQSNLRAAALKELIPDLGDVLTAGSLDRVYPYLLSIVHIHDQTYGVPFAGDAWIMASYLTMEMGPSPWSETLLWTNSMHMPLADSRGLALFYGYYAAGGTPPSSIESLDIQPDPLERELAWLWELSQAGVLSPDSLLLDSPESTLSAMKGYNAAALTTYSALSQARGIRTSFPPTPDGKSFTLGTGWSWAIATRVSSRRAKAINLLLWLSEPEFLANWTQAQGLIPNSTAALDYWPEGDAKVLAAGLSDHAVPYPSEEITAAIGPVLSQAARSVIMDGVLPADAAWEASRSFPH